MNHSVISTGGNIYHDYICDFDDSGRVITTTCDSISLWANDRDYQLGVEPIVTVFYADCYDMTEMDESDDGFIREIRQDSHSIMVEHGNTLALRVFKQSYAD